MAYIVSHPLVACWNWICTFLHHPRGQKPRGCTFWAQKFKIIMHQWTGGAGEISCSAPGITFGVLGLIPVTTFMPHSRNINALVLKGFYKHQCWCILQVLEPSNILVVFYCSLLCYRQYMICGVCSLVNNSTLCQCACSLLGRSYMEHCQH